MLDENKWNISVNRSYLVFSVPFENFRTTCYLFLLFCIKSKNKNLTWRKFGVTNINQNALISFDIINTVNNGEPSNFVWRRFKKITIKMFWLWGARITKKKSKFRIFLSFHTFAKVRTFPSSFWRLSPSSRSLFR